MPTAWAPTTGQATPQPIGGTNRPRQGRPLPPAGSNPVSPWAAGTVTPYTASSNLIGSQINPVSSANTNRATANATDAQTKLASFGFTPYQATPVADLSQANGMLTDANRNYQATNYNYAPANAQYDSAAQTLNAAKNTATGYQQNAGNLGMTAFTGGAGAGGGVARADTTALNAGLDKSDAYVGGPFADAADTTAIRGLTADQYKSTLSSPDRAALAAENYSLLEARSQPGYEQDTRNVNQRAAAMGRRGAGLVNSELADVATTRQRDLELGRRQLAADAAGQTLSDNINKTNLGLNVTQGFGSEDRAGAGVRLGQAGQLSSNANSRFGAEATNAGFQDSAYNRAESAAGRNASGAATYANTQRGVGNDLFGYGQAQAAGMERFGDNLTSQDNNRVNLIGDQATFQRGTANDLATNANTNYGQRNQQATQARADEYGQFDATRNSASDLTGYQNDERTYDANNRNELRGERSYQYGVNRDSISDERQRMLDEEALRNGQFERDYRTAALGYGATSPGTAYGQAANYYGNQAQGYGDAAGQAAQQFGYGTSAAQRRRTGAGTGTTTYSQPTYV